MNRNFRKIAILISSILVCLVVRCLAAEPIGYAWPKNDLLITSATPSSFKRLKNRGIYPLLVKLDSGYSIVCEGVDGQKYAMFLPFRDRFGEPLNIQDMGDTVEVSSHVVPVQNGHGDALGLRPTSWSTDIDLDNVDLKPGVVPLHSGVRYSVLAKSEGNLSIQFTSAVLTQMVVVAESETKYMTPMEYSKAVEVLIQDLKTKADKEIERTRGDYSGLHQTVSNIVVFYSGEFAADTVEIRSKLAKVYEERLIAAEATRDEQQKAKEAEQRKQEEERQRQQQAKEEEQRKQEQAKEEEQRKQEVRVQASISIIATVLQITNRNSYDWDTPVTVLVNSRYGYDVPKRYRLVRSGETILVDLTQCADFSNAQNKFDPSTAKVTTVRVSLAGHDFAEFNYAK
jgi:hypothetical protein